jgi:hypothetical protein
MFFSPKGWKSVAVNDGEAIPPEGYLNTLYAVS